MSDYKSVQPKNGFEMMCSGLEGPVSHEQRGMWVCVYYLPARGSLSSRSYVVYF